jgi:hypothetical protein
MSAAYRLSKEEQLLLDAAAPGPLARLLAPLSAKTWGLRSGDCASQAFPGEGATLVFSMRDLMPLTLHALRSPEHRPAKDQILDPRLWIDPKRPPTAADIKEGAWRHVDPKKVPAALELVSDHGIYLMSNGIPVQPSRVRNECESVFARGFDPYQDEHWQKWSARILGRQKVSRRVPLDWIRRAHLRQERELRIKVTRTGLRLHL